MYGKTWEDEDSQRLGVEYPHAPFWYLEAAGPNLSGASGRDIKERRKVLFSMYLNVGPILILNCRRGKTNAKEEAARCVAEAVVARE